MKLSEILLKMQDFIEDHPDVYDLNDEGEDCEEMKEFDELQDKIFSDNQTYFTWDVDGDCFRIDRAFDTVLEYLKENNLKLKDYEIGYLVDDKLIVLVETEK